MAIVYRKNDQGRYVYVCDSAPVHSANSGDTAIDVTNGVFYIYTTSWVAAGSGSTTSNIRLEVRNQSGSTMYKGSIVYIDGSTGNLPTVQLAQANSEVTSSRTVGVIEADINNNSSGFILILGAITDLDTRDVATNPFTTDTLVDGDLVYLSPDDPGYITNVKPSAPNHLVYIGVVVRTSPTNGYIEYQIQNGYEIEELHNVAIDTPVNRETLVYNSAISLWQNDFLNERDVQIRTVSGYAFFGSTFDFLCGTYLIGEFSGGASNVTITFDSPQEGQTYSMVFIQSASLINLILPSGYWLNDTAPFDFSTELASGERAMITATYLNSTWYFAVKKLQLV